MRKIFKILICGILLGVSIPITVSFYNTQLLLGGIVFGIIFGLVYFALYSKLPTKNPLVKSLILGLFLLFLPTYATISYLETMYLFPLEVATTSWLFYVKTSAYFATFMLIPSIVFGLAYWIMTDPTKFGNQIRNKLSR